MLKIISALLLCWALALTGVTHAVAAPLVVFDEGHGQRFVPGGDGSLDLSSLLEIFRRQGLEVRSHVGKIDDASLQGVSALVISGAFSPLSPSEISAVQRFVEGGGVLAVMLHIGPPMGSLLHAFGVDFSNGVIREQDGIIDGEPLNFQVTPAPGQILFAGLDRFDVYGAWALRNFDARSQVVAATGPHAWVDLNGDGQFSKGDARQNFGVVVAGKAGAGRFAVFGDDAIFQNRFLGADNRKLAANLGRWLTAE